MSWNELTTTQLEQVKRVRLHTAAFGELSLTGADGRLRAMAATYNELSGMLATKAIATGKYEDEEKSLPDYYIELNDTQKANIATFKSFVDGVLAGLASDKNPRNVANAKSFFEIASMWFGKAVSQTDFTQLNSEAKPMERKPLHSGQTFDIQVHEIKMYEHLNSLMAQIKPAADDPNKAKKDEICRLLALTGTWAEMALLQAYESLF